VLTSLLGAHDPLLGVVDENPFVELTDSPHSLLLFKT